MNEKVTIRWHYEGPMPYGIVGVDSEHVPLNDLVKWARRTRKRLRRDIRRRGEHGRESRRATSPVKRVHNHPPYEPICHERVFGGYLRGACLNDDGSDR